MSEASSIQPVDCDHCSLPVPGGAAGGDGPHFCCPGCRAVYSALHESGLEGFYGLRDISDEDERQPVGAALPEAPIDFEADWFQQRHTRELGDGSRQVDLYLEGVHCAGCVWITERMPRFVDGVIEARLDLSRARLSVRWDPEVGRLSDAIRWLTRFGYAAHPIRGETSASRTRGERRLLLKVGVSWALAANIMLLALAMYAGLDFSNDATLTAMVRWLSLGLAAVSVVYGGSEFLRRAALSVRSVFEEPGFGGLLRLSIDVPISLGIIVGFAHSGWATVTGSGEVWFDSIAVLIAALLTARWLQIRGRRAAGDAADRLLSLIPSTARRVSGQTTEQVDVNDLGIGDRIQVRPGEVVPADGTLLDCTTTVHRAVLTGESRPEKLAPGDAMHAGETNLGSPIELEVVAAGDDTRVGKLLAWVEQRAAQRAPIVQLADRLGGVFVLVTVLAAALTGLVWWQLDPTRAVAHTVALLVVACPCALGMATPLALAIGVGKGARRGIYIKHEDVLEALPELGWVVLDKTGTLTAGRMQVTDLVGSAEAFGLAAALESKSNHPIAQALTSQLDAQVLRGMVADVKSLREVVSDVEEHVGSGISGSVGSRSVKVGRPDWIISQAGPEQAFDVHDEVARLTGHGRTPVAVAVDGRVEALIGIGDPIRPEAAKFLRALERREITPVILSGDHPEVVRHVAGRLGVSAEHARGGVDPEGKAAFIERLVAESSQRVAMVGDGVNDAAALQLAHVGVAVDGGAEASLVAADVFVTRPGLEPVWELVTGADQVMNVVRCNLAVSAGYNVLAVLAAAFGLIGPLVAAVTMPMSSIAVVVSSLVQPSFGRRASQAGEDLDMSQQSKQGNDEHPIPTDSDRARPGSRRRSGVLVGDAKRPI